MLNQIARPLARQVVRRGTQARSAHHESHFKYPTLDDCIHPQGPWKENYEKQQRRYNTHLIVGVASFVLTCLAINQGEILFFNYLPPKPKE